MERYISDEELLYMMRCGSEEAQEALYRRYYKKVKNWILPFFGYSRGECEFDDYLQVAMMYVPSLFDSYRVDQKTSLKTFMYHVIRKRMVSYVYQMKKKQRSRYYSFVSFDEPVLSDEEMRYAELIGDPSLRYQPSSMLKVKEAELEYNLQLEQEASPRELAVIRYTDAGYRQQEIADILDISLRSVYNAVYRYHKKVKPLTSQNKCVKL